MKRITFALFACLYACLSIFASQPDAAQVDSLQQIASRAEQGDAEAQYRVGYWYYNGENFAKNFAKAVQWWLRSSKQGYAPATAGLARCYLQGNGVQTDSVRAAGLVKLALKQGSSATLEEYTGKADNGDRWSAKLLAEVYERGIGDPRKGGVRRDAERYAHFMSIVADPDDDESQLKLALGLLNAGNENEAYAALLRPAAHGNPSACFWIGKMLLEGKGVDMDKQLGISYLEKASKAGMPMADYYLGRSYWLGDGVAADKSKAVAFYRAAAEGGNHYGQYFLARALATGEGVAPSFSESIYWFERAAQRGHKVGFTKLINDTIPTSAFATYVRGIKLMRGGAYQEALQQFKKLEKTHKAEAQAMQGEIYCTEAYSGFNLKKGVKLLKSAAKAGNPEALYQLALLSGSGRGMKQDSEQAFSYMTTAAERGSAKAMEALANMLFEKGDFATAAIYYERSSGMMPLAKESLDRWLSVLKQGIGGTESDIAKVEAMAKKKVKDLLPEMLKSIKVTTAE